MTPPLSLKGHPVHYDSTAQTTQTVLLRVQHVCTPIGLLY